MSFESFAADIANIPEEQKIYNTIQIIVDNIKDLQWKLKESIESNKVYQDICKREKELLEKFKEFNDQLESIKKEKKAVIDEIKAENESDNEKLSNLKIQLAWRREALVQCFLRNIKNDVPTILYKEKNNWKKIRLEVSLNPKVKTLKWSIVTDEELRKKAEKAAKQLTNNN